MDLLDVLDVAQLFKAFRDGMTLAFVVCAFFFRDQLVAVFLYLIEVRAAQLMQHFQELIPQLLGT